MLIRTQTGGVGIALLCFCVLGAGAGTVVQWRRGPRGPAVVGVVVGILVPVLLLLDTPAIGSSQEIDSSRGHKIYNDPRFFPKTTVPTGGVARVGDMTVRVTGPVTTTPPPGAPSWWAAST